MIRLGLLGMGIAGQRHLSGLLRLSRDDIRLTAVATRSSERAALAAPFGADVYADYGELLRKAEVDAVIVALPHNLHKDAAIRAAQHGRHVLLEKPMATSLQDANRVRAACADNGVTLMLAHVHRFREEVIVARRMLRDGQLGVPASILDRFCVPGSEELPTWVWNRELGGGVLFYSGLNQIDRLRWLMECEVVEVYARAQTYGIPQGELTVENGLSAMLTFENGVIATISEHLPPYDLEYRYWDTEIFGTKGLLHIRTDDYIEFTGPEFNFKQSFRGYNHYARQLAAFVDAIATAAPPPINADDGFRSLAVAMAIYRSAYAGRSVLVTDTD